MTLEPYDPRKLDELALRLFDLAAAARKMAQRCRRYRVEDLALHDKKANEWRANLAQWVRKAQTDLEIRVLEIRSQRQGDTPVGQS